ncbi:MAG: YwmB family TATA-box binding protein [Syntrophomonadaceae bacterium]|jgi:hypothetical protein|nr:hypothetical protein [Syntrophomonadaceae bacterium]
MKKVIIYLSIFVALCSLSSYLIEKELEQKMKPPSPYYLSFASIGAISLESRLDCWAKIKYRLEEDELEQRLLEIVRALDIDGVSSIATEKKSSGDLLLSYTFQDQQLSYYISGQTDSRKNESYFLLNVVSPESKVDLSQIEKRLHRDRLDWQYYYLYTGKINHHMDKESRRAIIQVILENLGAEGGELYEDDNASSMAAYTPLFDNSIKVQQEKYNVQVAARSNQQQREAIVYIGQPLIMGDY